VRSGRTSPQHFIASWGHDWRDVVDQWAAFQQYCDEKGVVLDLDPRYRTQSGVAQTAVTTQAQATAEAADAAGDGVDPTQADGEVDDAQGNPIDPDEQQADARSPKLNGGSHHAP
jgi:hypothetical protein